MPARVVIVHNQTVFAEELSSALKSRQIEVAAFADPLAALPALAVPDRIELLITRVQFPPGRSNGIALARMTRLRRRDVKILFVARPEFKDAAEELGEFIPVPANITDVVTAATRLLGV